MIPRNLLVRAIVPTFVACVLASSPVYAQPATSSPAQAAFERGVAAYREERFGEAATLFEESYRLQPTLVARRNLALAYERMGRVLEAIDLFEAMLRDPAVSASVREEIARELAPLPPRVVHCRLVVVPTGATVRVDGREPRRDGDDILLDPGRHVFDIESEGHAPRRREVSPQPGERLTVEVRLDEAPGRLRIESTVPEAALRLDGADVGRGFAEREVSAGEHTIEVRARGYESFTRRVLVRAGAELRVSANLVQETSVFSRWWFWTGVGVLAAGAVVAGIALGLPESPPAQIPGAHYTINAIHFQ